MKGACKLQKGRPWGGCYSNHIARRQPTPGEWRSGGGNGLDPHLGEQAGSDCKSTVTNRERGGEELTVTASFWLGQLENGGAEASFRMWGGMMSYRLRCMVLVVPVYPAEGKV